MTMDNLLAFALGFVTATVLIVGVGFFWLKRKWKTILFGMGAKLFSKGLGKVGQGIGKGRAIPNADFREVDPRSDR
jgi:hypothetical protein